jgi:ubiquinone/menaquinone biosynthesis C-methylase UbiE
MPIFDHFSAIAPLYARVTYTKSVLISKIANLPVSGKLLDVGGGTGRVSSAIKELVDKVYVTDISYGMLKETLGAGFNPVCGGAEALPFPSDSFERVIMVDALHHVVDQTASAREMFRVLKPGGLLVIEEPDIRTFGVKLIALVEKLLLMRSHFLTPEQITKLFTEGEKKIWEEDGNVWVVIKK